MSVNWYVPWVLFSLFNNFPTHTRHTHLIFCSKIHMLQPWWHCIDTDLKFRKREITHKFLKHFHFLGKVKSPSNTFTFYRKVQKTLPFHFWFHIVHVYKADQMLFSTHLKIPIITPRVLKSPMYVKVQLLNWPIANPMQAIRNGCRFIRQQQLSCSCWGWAADSFKLLMAAASYTL